MSSTTVNSWITIIGIAITVASVWITWWLSSSQRRERRIREVASRYIELRLAVAPPRTTDGALKTFLAAGALGLSQSEMAECALQLVKSGQGDPLQHPSLKQQDVIRRALDKHVDFDNWASRTAFLISEVVDFPDDDPPKAT